MDKTLFSHYIERIEESIKEYEDFRIQSKNEEDSYDKSRDEIDEIWSKWTRTYIYNYLEKNPLKDSSILLGIIDKNNLYRKLSIRNVARRYNIPISIVCKWIDDGFLKCSVEIVTGRSHIEETTGEIIYWLNIYIDEDTLEEIERSDPQIAALKTMPAKHTKVELIRELRKKKENCLSKISAAIHNCAVYMFGDTYKFAKFILPLIKINDNDDEKKVEQLCAIIIKKDADISSLEKEVETLRKKNDRQDMPPQGPIMTTVNAAMWEGTLKAAFDAWEQIYSSNRSDWKREEFTAIVSSHFQGYHTGAEQLAWERLPSRYKAGRGRPRSKK